MELSSAESTVLKPWLHSLLIPQTFPQKVQIGGHSFLLSEPFSPDFVFLLSGPVYSEVFVVLRSRPDRLSTTLFRSISFLTTSLCPAPVNPIKPFLKGCQKRVIGQNHAVFSNPSDKNSFGTSEKREW